MHLASKLYQASVNPTWEGEGQYATRSTTTHNADNLKR